MATKVVITSYIDSLLQESGTQVPDSTIIAGMEDVVRKIELSKPELLRSMEVETAIASSPVTLHYIPPTLDVYCDGLKAVERRNLEHISSRYSLLNDYGDTCYYYVVGKLLYIYPWDATKSYTYRGVAYSVSNGTLTWCDRFVYPLALYCAYLTLYGRMSVEMAAIVASSQSGLSLDLSGLLSLDYTKPTSRLTADDVELANAELDKIRTRIAEYQAMTGADSVAASKLQNRVGTVAAIIANMNSIYTRYIEWFGMGGEK